MPRAQWCSSGYPPRIDAHEATPQPQKPSLVERLRDQRERHRERPLVIRAAVVVVGFTLVVAGAALLVLPGPAFAIIPIGFAILSLEFLWAERLMEKALEHADRAKADAMRRTPAQRRMIAAVTVLASAAGIAAILLWDIPYLPL